MGFGTFVDTEAWITETCIPRCTPVFKSQIRFNPLEVNKSSTCWEELFAASRNHLAVDQSLLIVQLQVGFWRPELSRIAHPLFGRVSPERNVLLPGTAQCLRVSG